MKQNGSMRVNNKTDWDTRDLRRVFTAVLQENRKHEGPFARTLNITVVPARYGGYYSGYAYFNTGSMRLRLPRPKHGALDVFKLAHLFEHELAHCRGYRHKGMCTLNDWRHAKPESYPGLIGMTVRATPPKVRPKVDHRQRRYARTLAKIKSWKTKAKRAATALKKLERQRRYYERTMDGAGRVT